MWANLKLYKTERMHSWKEEEAQCAYFSLFSTLVFRLSLEFDCSITVLFFTACKKQARIITPVMIELSISKSFNEFVREKIESIFLIVNFWLVIYMKCQNVRLSVRHCWSTTATWFSVNYTGSNAWLWDQILPILYEINTVKEVDIRV